MPYFLIILLLCFITFYEFLDIKPDGFLINKEFHNIFLFDVRSVALADCGLKV